MSNTQRLLREMVLWRSDPSLAPRLRAEALRGSADAQYALGLVYAEGRGVEEDMVESWAWLTLAVMQGDADAETLRYVVAERMSSLQCERAERRAATIAREIAGASTSQ